MSEKLDKIINVSLVKLMIIRFLIIHFHMIIIFKYYENSKYIDLFLMKN